MTKNEDIKDVKLREFLLENNFKENSVQFFEEKLGYDILNYLQKEYVSNYINNDKMLVIAPTSSGKTTVAMLKMVKILENEECKKKFIYMIPYAQLTNEKMDDFKIFDYFDLKITRKISNYQDGEGDILICSFHEMDSYLQYNPRIDEPDLFIFDELDVLGSSFFGPIVESVIASFMASNILNNILSITATVGDMNALAKWLKNSEILHISDYRPVPLIKEIVYNPKGLTAETIIDLYKKKEDVKGHPILVVIYNKKYVESLAHKISLIRPEKTMDLSNLTTKIESTSFTDSLIHNLKHGVGIFHRDIPKSVKEITITKFNDGEIDFLIASPSLARGVNLNCRTVVINPSLPYGKTIRKSDYEQISGRAGRKGKQDKGFSIIFTKDIPKKEMFEQKYINGPMEMLSSGFFDGEEFQYDQFELNFLKTLALFDLDVESLKNKYSNFFFVSGMNESYKESFLDEIIKSTISELRKLKMIEMGRTKYLISDMGKFYIKKQCYSIPSLGIRQFFKIINKIGLKIIDGDYEVSISNYYHIIRTIINTMDDSSLISLNTRKRDERISVKSNIDTFIRDRCGLFPSSNLKADLTFVIILNYMLGLPLKEIEYKFKCSISSFYRIKNEIPKIIDKLNLFISESFSYSEDDIDEEWISLTKYLSKSIKFGMPIAHIPFRLQISAKKIPRNSWYSIMKGLKNKYKENFPTSYKDIFSKETNFQFVETIGPSRDAVIKENIEGIINSEKKLRKILEKNELTINFLI